jgi:hypothetical protein
MAHTVLIFLLSVGVWDDQTCFEELYVEVPMNYDILYTSINVSLNLSKDQTKNPSFQISIMKISCSFNVLAK